VSDVRRLLWGWASGEFSEADLVDFADAHLPIEAITSVHDPKRPVFVALDVMSTIFGQPLNRRDALAVLHYLSLWETDPERAEDWIDEYWNSIDWDARLRETDQEPTPIDFAPSGVSPLDPSGSE